MGRELGVSSATGGEVDASYSSALLQRLVSVPVRLAPASAASGSTRGTGRMQAVSALAFDASGVLLISGTSSGSLSVYDLDEFTATTARVYDALLPGTSTRMPGLGEGPAGADCSPATAPLHTLTCPEAILSAKWHPRRSDDVGVVCAGSREVLLYALGSLPTRPTTVLSRETPGTIAADTSYLAGNTDFMFWTDINVAPLPLPQLQPQGRMAADKDEEEEDEDDDEGPPPADLSSCPTPSAASASSGVVVVTGDGMGKVRLYDTRQAKGGGVRWTAESGDALRSAAASMSSSSFFASSRSGPSGSSGPLASTAASRDVSSQRKENLGPGGGGAASSAFAPPLAGGKRPLGATSAASDSALPASSKAAASGASGVRAPTGFAPASSSSSLSSAPRYSPLAYAGANQRAQWSTEELSVRSVWSTPSLPNVVCVSTVGGGVVGWDVRKMTRQAFSSRSSPTSVFAWDAPAHLGAGWASTPFVDSAGHGPSGLAWASGSVGTWPWVRGVPGGAGSSSSSAPLLSSSNLDPRYPGTVTLAYSNGWAGVHDIETGMVLAIHRPDVTPEEADADADLTVASLGGGGTDGGRQAPRPAHRAFPSLFRDRLSVTTHPRSAIYLPGLSPSPSASSLLLVPQARTVLPRPVSHVAELTRTHFRGSVGVRVDNLEQPITRHALVVVNLFGRDETRTGRGRGGRRGAAPTPPQFIGVGEPAHYPRVTTAAHAVLPSPGHVTAVAAHANRHDFIVCGLAGGDLVALSTRRREGEEFI
jgi:hypothetical protein